MNYLRIWQEVDIQDLTDHILMVDEVLGFCPHCKKLGIELNELKECPSCKKKFKYVTSAQSRGGHYEIIGRIQKKLPHLQFVDYDDYIRLTSKDKAQNLFNL